MDLGYNAETDSEILERIKQQLRCDDFKRKNKCYFPNKVFQNYLKKHRHLLEEERNHKKRNSVIDIGTQKNEVSSIPDSNNSEFTALSTGFVKCWITTKFNRDKECLFNVEFNNCSCDKTYTWQQIIELCDYDENEATQRLILSERPIRDCGLKRTRF